MRMIRILSVNSDNADFLYKFYVIIYKSAKNQRFLFGSASSAFNISLRLNKNYILEIQSVNSAKFIAGISSLFFLRKPFKSLNNLLIFASFNAANVLKPAFLTC